MAALSNVNPTFLDLAQLMGADGAIMTVAEILNKQHTMFSDAVFLEGNMIDGHVHNVRTGLPTPTWVSMYKGVQPTKGTTVQVKDTVGRLEDYSEVACTLVDLNSNAAAFRLREDAAHIEGIRQSFVTTMVYGNEKTDYTKFTGLAPRYNSLSAANAENIIDAGGTGTDNASIWLVVWGEDSVFGIVPKGLPAGIQVEDKGRVTVENVDGNNGRKEMYRTFYALNGGLCVKDWRQAVRICNIDKSLLSPTAATGANLHQLMYEAISQIDDLGRGRPAFYMPRAVKTIFGQQAATGVANSTLTVENVGGVPVDMFHGIPVRRDDVLAADEARVV